MTWNVGAGLEGRGVIVAGAGGQIGSEVARAFAGAGARVCAVDLQAGELDELVAGLEGQGHVAVAADLRRLDSHELVISRAQEKLGGVYALIHLAAVLRRRASVDDITEADWDVQLDTNLKAAFFLCRASARAMIAKGDGGRIVTFTSQGWWTGGFEGSVVYAASKGGIVSMTRGLARTYGPYGLTVNAVAPGQVDTPMLREGLSDDALEALKRQTPLGYVARPEDIAGTVVFLASQHAAYITGATINISGGLLMY